MIDEQGALSFDGAVEILRPAFPDDELILIGGQALNYWVLRYRAIDPEMPNVVGVTSP